MITIRMAEVYVNRRNKEKSFHGQWITYRDLGTRQLVKFPNDYEFGFSFLDPNAWRVFLANYKDSTGRKLPRYSLNENPVTYCVVCRGMPKGMHYLHNPQVRCGSTVLFPARDKNGKLLNCIHGLLPRA